MLSQPMLKEVCKGKSRIRVRCPGVVSVLVGLELAQRGEDGVWTWEGEALQTDTIMSLVIGSDYFATGVEILDD